MCMYTYCLEGGVGQDLEERTVSRPEKPCLSGPLNDQRQDCFVEI